MEKLAYLLPNEFTPSWTEKDYQKAKAKINNIYGQQYELLEINYTYTGENILSKIKDDLNMKYQWSEIDGIIIYDVDTLAIGHDATVDFLTYLVKRGVPITVYRQHWFGSIYAKKHSNLEEYYEDELTAYRNYQSVQEKLAETKQINHRYKTANNIASCKKYKLVTKKPAYDYLEDYYSKKQCFPKYRIIDNSEYRICRNTFKKYCTDIRKKHG